MSDGYLSLLTHRATMEGALASFLSMAQYGGFQLYFSAFSDCIRFFPEKCAEILIHLAPLVDPMEHLLLYKCAKLLRHCPVFLNQLYQFSRSFESKWPFMNFFKIERMKDRNERLIMARQAELFVSDFGQDLLPIAMNFAEDESAVVRNQSVYIFCELYRSDKAVVNTIGSLAKGSWHQRLILAKIIAELGVPEELEKWGNVICSDNVQSVKDCFGYCRGSVDPLKV
jgi:hypothetical protein